MDIFKIKELEERRKEIDLELRELTIAPMTDITQVERIYTLFVAYCNDESIQVQSKKGRRLFIAMILLFYSPSVFVGGGRLVKGLRSILQGIVGYQTPEAVSVCMRSVITEYSVYAKFRNSVDAACFFVEARL